jgi:hypothetical protein
MEMTGMTVLYALWHSCQPDPEIDRDEEKLIGIYSTEAKAREAIERLRLQPGFMDYPEGFEIQPSLVDATGWDEGFVRVWGDEEPVKDTRPRD